MRCDSKQTLFVVAVGWVLCLLLFEERSDAVMMMQQCPLFEIEMIAETFVDAIV